MIVRHWPIVMGCNPVSPGCERCIGAGWVQHVARMRIVEADRVKGISVIEDGRSQWTGDILLRCDTLFKPATTFTPCVWTIPTGDLFHPDVPDDFRLVAFQVMHATTMKRRENARHQFLISTKFPEAMRQWASKLSYDPEARQVHLPKYGGRPYWRTNPHIVAAVSAEDQTRVNERGAALLKVMAARRAVVLEPLLGPVNSIPGVPDTKVYWSAKRRTRVPDDPNGISQKIDLVLAGGEVGTGARECHLEWLIRAKELCQRGGVAFELLQGGANVWFRGEPFVTKDRAAKILSELPYPLGNKR